MHSKQLPLLLLLLPVPGFSQTPDATLDSIWSVYIEKYKDIAMDEMERSGVPASIKLAQGILESRAGTSLLAQSANNHFGIKCGRGWKGQTFFKDDDERNKKGERVNSCFRRYPSVVECFADHSEFIRNPEKKYRYGFLFDLDPRDYKAWAQGLQDAGYSSVYYYAEKLIFFIERYHLYEYDWLAVNGRVALKRLAEVNQVKMVQAREGETLADIAALYNLSLEKLQGYNENRYAPDQPLGVGDWIFVQQKRDKWSGPEQFHEVGEDQTLFDIAQRYGVQTQALRRLNGLKNDAEPAAGERIRLRGKRAPGESVHLKRNEAAAVVSKEPADTAKTVEPLASDAFIIEMLPEEKLFAPVPVYWPAEMDTTTTARSPVPAHLLLTGETGFYHTVTKGETLYSIARKYGISTARLKQLNRLQDSVVRVGQSLRVK